MVTVATATPKGAPLASIVAVLGGIGGCSREGEGWGGVAAGLVVTLATGS